MNKYKDLLLNLIEYVEFLQPKTTDNVWNVKTFFDINDIGKNPYININPSDKVWLNIKKPSKPLFPKVPNEIKDCIEYDRRSPFVEPKLKVFEANDLEEKKALKISEAKEWIQKVWYPWLNNAEKIKQIRKIHDNLFDTMLKLKNEGEADNRELICGFCNVSKLIINDNKKQIYEDLGPLFLQVCEIKINEDNKDIIEILPTTNSIDIRWSVIKEINKSAYKNIKKWVMDNNNFDDLDICLDKHSYKKIFIEIINRLKEDVDFCKNNILNYNKLKNILISNGDKTDKNKYTIDNRWLFSLRDRPNNRIISDLHLWKREINNLKLEEIDNLPWFLKALVDKNFDVYKKEKNQENKKYFFPLPSNKEQSYVINHLLDGPGSIIQGPPGTGKSHTIANIISFYLSKGKSVLVSSSSAGALEVIRDKLPKEIQTMTASLLSSDDKSINDFDKSINDVEYYLSNFNIEEKQRQLKESFNIIKEIDDNIKKIEKSIEELFLNKNKEIIYKGSPIQPNELLIKINKFKEEIDTVKYKTQKINENTFNHIKCKLDELLNIKKELIILNQKDLDKKNFNGNILNYIDIPTYEEFIKSKEYYNLMLSILNKFNNGELSILYFNKNNNNNNKTFNIDNIKSVKDYINKSNDHLLSKTYSIEDILDNIHINNIKNIQEDLQSIIELNKHIRQNNIEFIKNNIINNNNIDLFFKFKKHANSLLKNFNKYKDIEIYIPSNCINNVDILNSIKQKQQDNSSSLSVSVMLFLNKITKKDIGYITINGLKPSSKKDWSIIYNYLKFINKVELFINEWKNTKKRYIKNSQINNILKNEKNYKKSLINMINDIELIIKYKNILTHSVSHVNECIKKHIYRYKNNNLEKYILKNDNYESIKNNIDEIYNNICLYQQLKKKWLTWKNKIKLLNQSGFLGKCIINDFNEGLCKDDFNDQSFWEDVGKKIEVYNNYVDFENKLIKISKEIKNDYNIDVSIWLKMIDEQYESFKEKNINIFDYWHLCILDSKFSFNNNLKVNDLIKKRNNLKDKQKSYKLKFITDKVWLELYNRITPQEMRALKNYTSSIRKQGSGSGKKAKRYKVLARKAMQDAFSTISCWIMPHGRVCESLPAKIGLFDLVIIDEASQSNINALPTLLRGKQILIVGDDKQVSPSSSLSEDKDIKYIQNNLIHSQPYRDRILPDFSIYDLFNVIFANHSIMLKEHFRSVMDIISYSNYYYYQNRIIPLRIPNINEKLSPPLVDVLVKNSIYENKINLGEANYIVDEIVELLKEDKTKNKTIGIITLPSSSDKQQKVIRELLIKKISQKEMLNNEIMIGTPTAFQGKERDIIFLSVMWDGRKNTNGRRYEPPSQESFKQRFNVAMSRARDRIYLVRSNDDIKFKPNGLLQNILDHFNDQNKYIDKNVSSEYMNKQFVTSFEKDLYNELEKMNYNVLFHPGEKYAEVDLCIEDSLGTRIGIQCEGDKPEKSFDFKETMSIKDKLDRIGWKIIYLFANDFYSDKEKFMNCLINELNNNKIFIDKEQDKHIKTKNNRVEHKTYIYKKENNKITYLEKSKNKNFIKMENSKNTRQLNSDWKVEYIAFLNFIKHSKNVSYDTKIETNKIQEDLLNNKKVEKNIIKKTLKENHWPNNTEEWPQNKDLLLLLCDSPFEKEFLDNIMNNNEAYKIRPQYLRDNYYMDFLLQDKCGHKIVVECDGDTYHGLKTYDNDKNRENYLSKNENLVFWRCSFSDWKNSETRKELLKDLFLKMKNIGFNI